MELRAWFDGQGVKDPGGHNPNKGGTVPIEGVKITLTDANHSSSAPDGTYTGEPCGVVLELEDGLKIYFAGDTNVFGDMSLIAASTSRTWRCSRSATTSRWGRARQPSRSSCSGSVRVVPSHYGTFPMFTGTPAALRELVPEGVEILASEPGETLEL